MMLEVVILIMCIAGAGLALLVVRLQKRVDTLSSHMGILMVWYDKTAKNGARRENLNVLKRARRGGDAGRDFLL